MMRLSKIAEKVPFDVVRDSEFHSLGSVKQSFPKQLGFVENDKYLQTMLKNPNISSVITTEELILSIPEEVGIGISKNPRKSFYAIHNHLAEHTDFYGKPFDTEIAKSDRIHPTAYIAPKNVRIGERCEIGPNVSILEGSIIEDDVIIRAGSVIGSEGFEFERIGKEVIPVIHAGGVLIHNGVEVQANCCISKALFGGHTEIGEDTKLDNLVHIAHAVTVGKRCLLAACVMVAGSTTIGDNVWIGPSAVISSEVVVGSQASITIGSVVTRDVAPYQRVTGNFAVDHEKFIAFLRTIR